MFGTEEIPKLKPEGKPNKLENGLEKEKRVENGKGRKAILVIFFLTIILSVIFWIKGNFHSWLADFFGPSTWTFSR